MAHGASSNGLARVEADQLLRKKNLKKPILVRVTKGKIFSKLFDVLGILLVSNPTEIKWNHILRKVLNHKGAFHPLDLFERSCVSLAQLAHFSGFPPSCFPRGPGRRSSVWCDPFPALPASFSLLEFLPARLKGFIPA